MKTDGRGLRKLLLALISTIGALTFVGPAPASAGTMQIAGAQSAPVSSGACFDSNALTSYTMTGALIGCWYTDTSVIHPAQLNGTSSGTVQATGTEHFVGCLDLNGDRACGPRDPSETLQFSYQFSGKFDPMSGAETHGRCQHPITSGTGNFTAATGVITFTDRSLSSSVRRFAFEIGERRRPPWRESD